MEWNCSACSEKILQKRHFLFKIEHSLYLVEKFIILKVYIDQQFSIDFLFLEISLYIFSGQSFAPELCMNVRQKIVRSHKLSSPALRLYSALTCRSKVIS